MSGVAGLGGWRWIFILEGIATVLIAISAFFIIHDEPATAKFLTEEERAWVVSRLQTQGSRSDDVAVEEPEKFSWKYARQAFTDWQVLTAMFMNLGLLGPLYGEIRHSRPEPAARLLTRNLGISMFLPTIIRGLGYTAANAQLLTVRSKYLCRLVLVDHSEPLIG